MPTVDVETTVTIDMYQFNDADLIEELYERGISSLDNESDESITEEYINRGLHTDLSILAENFTLLELFKDWPNNTDKLELIKYINNK